MVSSYRNPLGFIILLLLGACSTLPNPSSSENSASDRPRDNNEALLVENLVTEAARQGTLDIGGVRNILSSQQTAPPSAVIEPVVPTIPMTANRVVERAINDYLQNRRSVLNLWIERSATYFPMIEKIFAEEEVPDELKYVALGESSLRPTARSYAGALGMWQFMAATGRGAGLTINPWVDERMDPELSTRAAARHFKELYETYHQNWHLALAGYNCSYRCITRAVVHAGGSIDDPPSFWEIYPFLPKETREFIPKFIAAALLVSNPKMYGIQAESFGQELTYDVVEISGMLGLEEAAELAGTTVAVLYSLNPSLRRPTLPDSNEPFALKIPAGTYDRFVATFNRLPEEEKIAPTEYVVQRGDTLGKIAGQFNTGVAELQAVNGIRGFLIYPDQKLLIPGTGVNTHIAITSTQRTLVKYDELQFRPIKLREEFQLVEQTAPKGKAPLMAVSLSSDIEDSLVVPTLYRVLSGDTLGQISEKFDVSVQEIQQWNNLLGTLIQVGQDLTLHTAATTPRTTLYQVQRGDNLGAIARRFGVSIDNLKRWNGLSGDIIYPGQSLQLN